MSCQLATPAYDPLQVMMRAAHHSAYITHFYLLYLYTAPLCGWFFEMQVYRTDSPSVVIDLSRSSLLLAHIYTSRPVQALRSQEFWGTRPPACQLVVWSVFTPLRTLTNVGFAHHLPMAAQPRNKCYHYHEKCWRVEGCLPWHLQDNIMVNSHVK